MDDVSQSYISNAGKDRTGVVTAIFLHRLGMDREYIVDDYMKSRDNLKEMINSYVEQFPAVDKAIITPHRRYMEAFLEWLAGQ